ncbi:sensor histidine kinase [Rubripirellula reticaptiva]|uniref:histidine kinase n=1 Tax=Rubripirellula reticaptiva TaxID=2528013 RepID=A0A5C6F5E9_9BACT|nr:ATP-binding protein [Rubripirellula reticaptiva]TWU55079.1 Sensor histidine kinase LiaS [Rubripirellula reticaptiva]
MLEDSDATEPAASIVTASEIIEADRASIAGEIHDALVPYLFAASASIGRLKAEIDAPADSPSAKRIDQLAELVDQAMAVSRQILTSTYPPELVGTLWARAARDTLGRLFGDSSVTVDWQLSADVNEVTEPVAVVCYRIVIEAVRNAIRHGKATRVEVVGRSFAGHHVITVADDGCGFDTEAVPSGHFGIKSMRGRAQIIGAKLEIESAPGESTVVRLQVPSHV